MTITKQPRSRKGAGKAAATATSPSPDPLPSQGSSPTATGADEVTSNPAPIGHNQPPEPTPLEAFKAHVDDLYMEAETWLDGEPISNADQAAKVTALKGMLSAAAKDADAKRAEEKAPHLEAGRQVDAAWKPIVDRAKKALTVAQKALTPWLEAVEAENRRKALEAQREADEAAARLREQAIASRESSALADEDVREVLEDEAKAAARRAAAATKQTSTVRTDHGKATLRTVWLFEVEDRRALLNHYLRQKPEAFEELLRDLAGKDVRAGARVLPGVRIWDERRAI